jgi:lysozyme family protein
MANFEPLALKILRWEGGFSDHPDDHGGPTNRGVTLSTWRQAGYDKDGDKDIDTDDIRLLTVEDFRMVLRKFYWNRWLADEISNQAIAGILVDWVWCSGKWGIIIPQRILQVADDGIVGQITISKLNAIDADKFLLRIYNSRLAFIRNILRNDPTQKKFEQGWIRRLNDFL